MKVYTVIIIQFMIWSGFSFAEWLSANDWILYKIIMFFVFFYLAVIIGNLFILSPKKTVITTLFSLGMYSIFHLIMYSIIGG